MSRSKQWRAGTRRHRRYARIARALRLQRTRHLGTVDVRVPLDANTTYAVSGALNALRIWQRS